MAARPAAPSRQPSNNLPTSRRRSAPLGLAVRAVPPGLTSFGWGPRERDTLRAPTEPVSARALSSARPARNRHVAAARQHPIDMMRLLCPQILTVNTDIADRRCRATTGLMHRSTRSPPGHTRAMAPANPERVPWPALTALYRLQWLARNAISAYLRIPIVTRYSRGISMPSSPRYLSWKVTKSRSSCFRRCGSQLAASALVGP